MGAEKNFLSGLENVIKKVTRTGYKKGAETVLKEFAPHAGRELKKGNGAIMKTFNEIGRAIKKM